MNKFIVHSENSTKVRVLRRRVNNNMNVTGVLLVAIFSLFKLIAADSETFYLLTIRSGSILQYASVVNENGILYFGSGNTLHGVITDSGLFKTSDGAYISVESDGSLSVGDEGSATSGFSIKNGYLSYDSSSGFYAKQQGSDYLVSVDNTDGAIGVGLSARSSSGSVVPDFSASDTTSLSSLVSTETPYLSTIPIWSSTELNSSTAVTTTITNFTATSSISYETVDISSSISNSTSSIIVSSVNVADTIGVRMSACVVAVMALLI